MKMSQSLVRWTAAVVHCAARCTILWYCSRWRCGLHPPPHTDGGNSRTNRTNSQIGHALHHTESNRRGGVGIPRVTRGNYSTIGWSDSAFFWPIFKTDNCYLSEFCCCCKILFFTSNNTRQTENPKYFFKNIFLSPPK